MKIMTTQTAMKKAASPLVLNLSEQSNEVQNQGDASDDDSDEERSVGAIQLLQ